jgi:hypothetical protein
MEPYGCFLIFSSSWLVAFLAPLRETLPEPIVRE